MMAPTIKSSPAATVLTAERIAEMPLSPFDVSIPGVAHRVLWRDGTSTAGVMSVAAGCRLGAHAHRLNHHHMWVLDGAVRILDEIVGAGSYAHIPAGCEHDLDARESQGCTVFYLYLSPSS